MWQNVFLSFKNNFFLSTVPGSSMQCVYLYAFWFFIWGLLIPVITSVMGLMLLIMTGSGLFFISGLEYPVGEILLIFVPLLLLLSLVKESLSLLYTSTQSCGGDLLLKVIGSQWYWNYEISTFDNLFFSSYMSNLDDLSLGGVRFLEVDNRLILPSHTVVQCNITSSDVLHAFMVSSLGVKADATAGILNVLHFNLDKVGLHTGQCSEICGMNHSYMPIVLECCPMQLYKYFLQMNF